MFDLVYPPIFRPNLTNPVEIRFLNKVEYEEMNYYEPGSPYHIEVKPIQCPICEYFKKRDIPDTTKHTIETKIVNTDIGKIYYERKLKNIHSIELKRSPLQLPYELTRNKYVV